MDCVEEKNSPEEVGKTNILHLDDPSLQHILLKCDPTSYVNVIRSCKRFHTLSQTGLNERTWKQFITKHLVHFLCAIVNSHQVTNEVDHYYRHYRNLTKLNEEPHRIRADAAQLILHNLLQSVRLINFIRSNHHEDTVAMRKMSPTIHAIIMYSLKAKDLHMKSIYSVFYILGVSECYVFENVKGSADKVNDTIVLCKMMWGFSIFTCSNTTSRKNVSLSPAVFEYHEEFKDWGTKGNSYNVAIICQRLSLRIFNNKETIVPETLVELCNLKLQVEVEKEGECLHEGDGEYRVLDASTKMKTIWGIKERLFKNCVDFVSYLDRTELKKSEYDVKGSFKMFLRPLVAFCSLAKFSSEEQFICNLIDSIEPFSKIFNASRKAFFPNMAQILSSVDVTRSNIGFYKEKAEKRIVFVIGTNEVAFKNTEGWGIIATTMNNRSFKWDMGDKTDEEDKKETDELLAVFNDHFNFQDSFGLPGWKVTSGLLSALYFHAVFM